MAPKKRQAWGDRSDSDEPLSPVAAPTKTMAPDLPPIDEPTASVPKTSGKGGNGTGPDLTATIQKLSAAEAHRVLCKLASSSDAVRQLVLKAVNAEAGSSKGGAKAGAAASATPPAAAKGAPAPAAPSAAELGKDKAWAKLTSAERAAAAVLGYSEQSWEGEEAPEASATHWKKLSDKMRKAAQALGYTQEEWDADVPAAEPSPATAKPAAQAKANGTAPAAQSAAEAAKAKQEEEAAAAAAAAAVAEAAEAAEAIAAAPAAEDDDGWATVTTKKNRKGGGGGGGGGAGAGAPAAGEPREQKREAPREKRDFDKRPSGSAPVPRAVSGAAAAASAVAGPPASPAEIDAALAAYDNGMIFGCKNDTYDENMARSMFGLPRQHMAAVEKITERTVIFLLNYSSKVMHGVYILDGPREKSCGLNLVADAWIQNRNLLARANDNAPGSPFPAQVRVKNLRKCAPIKEASWTHIPSVKHRKPGGPLHYELWLSKQQAHDLIKMFLSRG